MFALLTASETKRKAKTAKTAKQPAKTAKKPAPKGKVQQFDSVDDPAFLATLDPDIRKMVTALRAIGKTGVWKK